MQVLPGPKCASVTRNEDLDWLSQEITEGWKPLGRRLGIKEATLTAIHMENEEYTEKAYRMLLHWKQKEGLAATFGVMYNASCHKSVKRKDSRKNFPAKWMRLLSSFFRSFRATLLMKRF